jgi:hypothetical protein
MATPDEIKESELGNKARSLAVVCEDRHPLVWAADYGCLLVYETPDCSGEFHRFENLDQVENFLVKREESELENPCRLFQTADPVPQGLQIFIFERQSTNVFVKLDGASQLFFRLLHATANTCVAGEVERDHGNFGMYRLRSEQNGFRLLYTLDPPNRIGETDPPACGFRINLYQMAGNRCGHISLLSRHVEVNACA